MRFGGHHIGVVAYHESLSHVQSTTDLPAAAPAGQRGGRSQGGSHVHHAPVDEGGAQLGSCSIATGTPQSFPLASPPAFRTGFGVDHPSAVVRC
jgi:hypothetical protein